MSWGLLLWWTSPWDLFTKGDKMKKFELNLSKYNVTIKLPTTVIDEKTGKEERIFKDTEIEYPLCNNINELLRSKGVFKSGEDIAEAIMLAKKIGDTNSPDSMILDERETEILKTCLNKFIALTESGQADFGGPLHEEAICRVFSMKEVK